VSYRLHVAEHLRLLILEALAEAPAYTLAPALLKAVAHNIGIPATADQVATELSWLSEQGLLLWAGPGRPAILSERGLEVAQGIASVPGVARPKPKPLP
jgi:hypothetical protein